MSHEIVQKNEADTDSAADSGPGRHPNRTDENHAERRLRDLLRLNHELISTHDVPRILQRIVDIGKELLDARYAAIGVVGDEHRINELIHAGMDRDVVEMIGRVPQGRGLLGALIDDPRPLRLDFLQADPRSGSFPPHHSIMQSFLGVPIRVHEAIYGMLYIADSVKGSFSDADEELAEALAATAGMSIQNARQFDASTYRAAWSSALAEIAHRPVETDGEDQVGSILEEVRNLASADLSFVALVSSTGQAVVEWADGAGAGDLSDVSFPLDNEVVTQAIRRGQAVLVEGLIREGSGALAIPALLGPSMVVPFTRHDRSLAALVVCREVGRSPFGSWDVEMGTAFATHIDVALHRRELTQARQHLAVLQDRGRIARDLHDHVIQSLFATGLNLEEVAAMVDGDAAAGIAAQIARIDAAITQIRQSIFSLQHETRADSASVRTRILQIIDHVTAQAPSTTHLVLAGPVDTAVSGACRDDVAAVVTEMLINVVRHAHASRVDIHVTATDASVTVEVADDGVGPGDHTEVSGLLNLRRRAERQGGTFGIEERSDGGTRARWSVPL